MKYIFGFLGLFLICFNTPAQNIPNLVSMYNTDSTLRGTGVLKNGLMEGLWRFENPKTNRLIQTIQFEGGRREGLLTTFYPNGNKNTEAEFRNNELTGIFKQYDESGALIVDRVFRDSIPVGPYREYFGRSVPAAEILIVNPRQVKLEGQYVDGKKDGKWVSYYASGEPAKVETFKNGIQEGPAVEFFLDGSILSEVLYKEGRPDGPYVRYSLPRMVEEKGNFKNGKRVGKWETYFPSSRIIESETFYDDNGNRTGEWKFYYMSKRIARTEKYENDLAIGTWEEFYPNRNLAKKKTYELGVPVGEYTEYHQNGKISVKGQYKSGAKDGLWISYFPEGKVYSIGEYKNDVKTGLWKYFNKIGILIAEGEYTLGSENGQWFYYYDGGQLKSIGSYFLGFEEGTWGLFYDNKQLTQEEYWSNGRLMNVSDYNSYDGSKKLDKGTLTDGNGTRITYYTSGTVESIGNYKNGKADGNWTYFHDNGKKASEGRMVDGKKEGAWRYFNIAGRLEQIIQYKNDEVVDTSN